jgi:transglutaminase-like putative cysteine protease
MPRLPAILFALMVTWYCPVAGQGAAGSSDGGPVSDSLAMAELARELVAGARTDSARAAAVYEWVARNVSYDVAGYLAGRVFAGTAESVFRRREAVCSGYVALYERLAREAGLETVTITGYAKGFDHEPGRNTKRSNHAWLAVKLGGEWRLVDPTWGAGAVRGSRFEPGFSWAYFLVPAEELILSHFPDKAVWQFLAKPLGRREFERMASVPRSLLEVGFTAEALRGAALAAAKVGFPAVGPQGDRVRVVRAPLAGTLARSAVVDVEVVWPGAADVAVVSGGRWTHLTQAGDRFHGNALADDGTVWVVGRTDTDPLSYRTLLHYRVR